MVRLDTEPVRRHMSVFDSSCFLFLRDPHGGVEDLAAIQAAGFQAVFCNIGDHAPAEWEAVVRPRALSLGMTCGPWLRTADAAGAFSVDKLGELVRCADQWQSPLIVNSESELKGSGATYTTLIRDTVSDREAALSMEPWPFDNVEWWPLADMPVLPQMFSDLDWYDPVPVRDIWHDYGVKCVFPTFGSYGKSVPSDYPLVAPYSLYTADDCAGDYQAWKATGTGWVGCVQVEDEMATVIGTNDGVAAEYNRLRDLDPAGTLLVKQGNKWPSLDTLDEIPLEQWKAYDKAQRRAQILVDDHDQAVRST